MKDPSLQRFGTEAETNRWFRKRARSYRSEALADGGGGPASAVRRSPKTAAMVGSPMPACSRQECQVCKQIDDGSGVGERGDEKVALLLVSYDRYALGQARSFRMTSSRRQRKHGGTLRLLRKNKKDK